MSDIRIKNNNKQAILDELEFAVKRSLTAVGMQAVSDIVSSSDFPVDTGLLRNSITFAVSGEAPYESSYQSFKGDKRGGYRGKAPNDKIPAVYIGTNVEYAKYVEFGTSKMNGRDFMFKPLRANLGNYKEIMKAYLK